MATYYLAISKDAVGKGQEYLPKDFFGKQELNAEKFGWSSVVFYTEKPDLKSQTFNEYFLVKVTMDGDEREFRRDGCRPIGEGRYKFDLAKDERYRHRHTDIGVQRDSMEVSIEAQVLANGKEVTKSDIHDVKIKKSVDKLAVSRENPVLKAASHLKHKVLGNAKSHETHEEKRHHKM